MKLHYSQTCCAEPRTRATFYYLMKLHYSQTDCGRYADFARFTTLWNYTTLKRIIARFFIIAVLLPYEITLLSNDSRFSDRRPLFYYLMKLHYSQTHLLASAIVKMFYYLMKLHYSQTSNENKLRHYNSQGNIIKWLYYKPKIIFLQQFRTYLYPKYKDFLAEVSESCFDFQ